MKNPKNNIIKEIEESFAKELKDKPKSDDIYAIKMELPEAVGIDNLVLDLMNLDYSSSFVDNVLTVYKKY